MSKPTFQTARTNRTGTLIRAARKQNGMSLREFGVQLGVSGQQVQNYETGKQAPDKTTIAEWIGSDVCWVHQLGLEMFGLRFGDLIQAALVPDAKRYALTAKGELACTQ